MNDRELAREVGSAIAGAITPLFTRLEKCVCRIEDTVVAFTLRRHITDRVKRQHRELIQWLGGRCPCCDERVVIDDNGDVLDAEYDHFFSRERRAFDETWLICKPCHREVTVGGRAERQVEFQAYLRKAARFDDDGQTELSFT